VVDHPTAPNLWRFGTRDWVRGILDPERIVGPHYFRNTTHRDGDMVTFVQDTIGSQLEDLKGEELAAFRQKIENVALALASEAGLAPDGSADLAGRVAAGREAIVNEFACIDCHKFHDDGELGAAPDLTGYGSREWLLAFIANPENQRFYPETNDRMPAFAANPENPAANRLRADELRTLVDWLRGKWYDADIPE
jgi:ubiquinol-cytochrome c reductase cytochrome b subunit